MKLNHCYCTKINIKSKTSDNSVFKFIIIKLRYWEYLNSPKVKNSLQNLSEFIQ